MIDGIHTLNVLLEVAEERHAQDETWGLQDLPFHHPVDGKGVTLVGQEYGSWAQSFKDACDSRRALMKSGGPDRRSGLLVLLEEVAEAAAETRPEKIREELVQVAAVAVKLIEALDRAEAKAHGPGCELGMWHGGDCGPSAVLRMTEGVRASMTADSVPDTFKLRSEAIVEVIRASGFAAWDRDVPPVPDRVREAMDTFVAGIPLAEAVASLSPDLPDATLEFRMEPIPFLREDAQARMDDLIGSAVHPLHGPAVRHPWGGEGRLHGICRCGEGRDAEVHQCPDCGHPVHAERCTKAVEISSPADTAVCGCSGG